MSGVVPYLLLGDVRDGALLQQPLAHGEVAVHAQALCMGVMPALFALEMSAAAPAS